MGTSRCACLLLLVYMQRQGSEGGGLLDVPAVNEFSRSRHQVMYLVQAASKPSGVYTPGTPSAASLPPSLRGGTLCRRLAGVACIDLFCCCCNCCCCCRRWQCCLAAAAKGDEGCGAEGWRDDVLRRTDPAPCGVRNLGLNMAVAVVVVSTFLPLDVGSRGLRSRGARAEGKGKL